jgi:hypothetical protein
MNGPLTHSEFSRKGGQAKTQKKLAASLANLRRAQEAQAAKCVGNGEDEARAHPVKK